MPKTNVDLPKSVYRDLNDFLRGELKHSHQTQGALAEYLNMTRSSVTYRFLGETAWTVPEFLGMLEFLGVDLKEFLQFLKKGVRT